MAASPVRRPLCGSNRRVAATLSASIVLLATLLGQTQAYQFFLEARTKRCFREDLPLGGETVFSYTIAQGSGDMFVNVRVTDALGKEIHEREQADHGVHTFRVPSRIPGDEEDSSTDGTRRRKEDGWTMHDDDKEDLGIGNDVHSADKILRQFPDAIGDNRLPYFFCFEHPRALHLPRLSLHDSPLRRRVFFAVKYGSESKNKEFYDALAKEEHLTSTEEMFRIVEDRVSDIVKKIDEMRLRESVMSRTSNRTSASVVIYGTLACVAILVSALISSYSTLHFLDKQKRRR